MAEEFEVATGTLLRALDILEQSGVIYRCHGKGTFVSKQIDVAQMPLSACFAFPEKNLRIPGHPEINALNSEFYRGLLQGSIDNNIKLQFAYFEQSPSPALLQKQLQELDKFDFVIFPSHQNIELMRQISEYKTVFSFLQYSPPHISLPNVIYSSYAREEALEKFVEFFLRTGCQSAAVVSRDISDKGTYFLRRVAEEGIATPEEGVWTVDLPSSGLRVEYLQNLMRQKKYDFIFCATTDYLRDIYEAAFNLNLFVGKDIMISGIACGITVSNLFPRYSYFKIPRFEQGVDIMKSAAEFFRWGQPIELPKLKVRFVEGQSARIRK
jgi:DNA-binding LacI/PurR family transcriptional regulator